MGPLILFILCFILGSTDAAGAYKSKYKPAIIGIDFGNTNNAISFYTNK